MEGKDYDGLMCIHCGGSLSIENTHLVCERDSSHKFTIKNGIVSFVGEHEFDQHWDANKETSIPETKLRSLRDS